MSCSQSAIWSVRDAALKLRREHDEDQPWHIRALKELRRYIREVHKDNAQKPVSTTAFVDWLLEDPVSDWHLYPPGRKITAVQMSLLMKRWYHVKSEPIGVLNDPLKLAHSLTRTRVKRR